MSSLLNIGSRSLAAAQGSLATISHNIANANVAGYTRQEAVLTTAAGQFTGSGFFGKGVDLTTVRRQYDQFLTAAVQSTTAQAAADAARAGALNSLDSLFADPELGVGAAIDRLFSAAGDLANRPADAAARQSFLSGVGELAGRVTGLGKQLEELGRLAEGSMAQAASQANARLGEIKALNTKIAEAQATGHAPNDLLDQRDVAVQALRGLIDVRSVDSADGSVSLFGANGAPLLVGSQQATLKSVPDPADATRTTIRLDVGNTSQYMDAAALAGGSLAGLMRFRDEDLASASNQLGRLATVIADRFNTRQALGVDATGAPGGPLFSVPGPQVQPHSANSGAATLGASVVDATALKASDYNVKWDGASYTITRLADGQSSTTAALPATVDGLAFSVSAAPATGNSWTVKPFAGAAAGIAARTMAPQQVATAYAAGVEAAAGNQGGAAVQSFQVVRAHSDNVLPVTITFNNPPTTFNVTGLASGNLANVAYTPGQRVPAAPADYNGWSVTFDGTAAAGDSFSVKPTASPRGDNRNALALQGLADLRLVDGATLNEAYAALLGDAGARVQSGRELADVSSRLQVEAVSRQQSASGVNLDEEAANLLRYQQAYQASAKIIQASQTLFDALLSATGR